METFWNGAYETTDKLSKSFEKAFTAVTGAAFYALKVRPVTIGDGLVRAATTRSVAAAEGCVRLRSSRKSGNHG
jgi:hypothetical protein